MSFIGAALIVGGLGAAGSIGGAMASKPGKLKYNPYGQLNPEQIALNKQIGPYLQNKIGQADQYNGTYAAPLTQNEQDLINQNSRLSALSQPTWETLMNPLDTNGELGSALNKYYTDAIYKPALKSYQEDIQPSIEEQYAGNGGYWGGARADAVAGGYSELADTMAAKRSELGWNALMNAQNAANAYGDYATKSAAIQAVPRAIEQYGLTQKYNEWVRNNPGASEYINQALSFLGLGTGTVTTEKSNAELYGGAALQGLSTAGLLAMYGGLGGGRSAVPTDPLSAYGGI